ncbi:hypothetical protein LPJ73_004678 [Coemansia sp. RSA 2703]|nr:hypothetical protein LPJ73_004678 [Coemansia sp. RSA 2703]KAJ2374354.1 hypothetical protein IW150_003153 [Coemansia sp. RSA 2607]KAJ2375150.1 hypothetical protein GGI05_007185 [Coemansia sp. RSA 2603]
MAKNKVASGKVQKKTPQTAAPPAKKLSEIDDIFATRPKAQPKTQSDATTKPAKTKPATNQPSAAKITVVDASHADKLANPQKQKAPPTDDDSFADSRGKNSKYTDDGMRVFYMDDLHIGEGEGDTELCPFDCKCCF